MMELLHLEFNLDPSLQRANFIVITTRTLIRLASRNIFASISASHAYVQTARPKNAYNVCRGLSLL